MTRGADVAIIWCYVINKPRNTLMPHPSQCHPSSLVILWSRTQEHISLRRWVECEDMNTVIKGTIKCACFCLTNDLSVTETIPIRLCTFLYFAEAMLSFCTTGISGSSGLLSCTYFMDQKACWNTDRTFLVSQICLHPGACHQARGSFFFFFLIELFF